MLITNSLADTYILRQVLEQGSSGGYDRNMQSFAARTLIEILSDSENEQSIGAQHKTDILINITRKITRDPLLFEAAFMLFNIANSDDPALLTRDPTEKTWSNYKTKALANATLSLAGYESYLEDIHRNSKPSSPDRDLVSCIQYEIFSIARQMFEDTAQKSPRIYFGLTEEGRLLQYIIDQISRNSPKPEVMIALKDTLVKVAVDEPQLVKTFLERQVFDSYGEFPYIWCANYRVRKDAAQELEGFSQIGKMWRWLEDITYGAVAYDSDPDSITSLSDIKRQRRNSLSILRP